MILSQYDIISYYKKTGAYIPCRDYVGTRRTYVYYVFFLIFIYAVCTFFF